MVEEQDVSATSSLVVCAVLRGLTRSHASFTRSCRSLLIEIAVVLVGVSRRVRSLSWLVSLLSQFSLFKRRFSLGAGGDRLCYDVEVHFKSGVIAALEH